MRLWRKQILQLLVWALTILIFGVIASLIASVLLTEQQNWHLVLENWRLILVLMGLGTAVALLSRLAEARLRPADGSGAIKNLRRELREEVRGRSYGARRELI